MMQQLLQFWNQLAHSGLKGQKYGQKKDRQQVAARFFDIKPV